MKHRSVLLVVLLGFVTLGFYWLYYYFSTRKELVKLGADIPTAWLIFIPFISIWWHYKWFRGGEYVTRAFNGTKLFLIATIPLVLAVIVCFIALSATTTSSTVTTYDNLEKISLSELNDQLAKEEVDTLVVKKQNIEIFLKDSENGLEEPDQYAARNSNVIPLSEELPALNNPNLESDINIEHDLSTDEFPIIIQNIIQNIIPISIIGFIFSLISTGMVVQAQNQFNDFDPAKPRRKLRTPSS